MRRPGPRPVSHALGAFTASLAPPTLLAEVQRAWPEAAGAVFAETTTPYAEKGGEVSVRCREAVLAQELSLMSEMVRERLNQALGRPAVTGLRIRVGTP
jgi:predicted nucleic acid-binding Zn ribbon protein